MISSDADNSIQSNSGSNLSFTSDGTPKAAETSSAATGSGSSVALPSAAFEAQTTNTYAISRKQIEDFQALVGWDALCEVNDRLFTNRPSLKQEVIAAFTQMVPFLEQQLEQFREQLQNLNRILILAEHEVKDPKHKKLCETLRDIVWKNWTECLPYLKGTATYFKESVQGISDSQFITGYALDHAIKTYHSMASKHSVNVKLARGFLDKLPATNQASIKPSFESLFNIFNISLEKFERVLLKDKFYVRCKEYLDSSLWTDPATSSKTSTGKALMAEANQRYSDFLEGYMRRGLENLKTAITNSSIPKEFHPSLIQTLDEVLKLELAEIQAAHATTLASLTQDSFEAFRCYYTFEANLEITFGCHLKIDLQTIVDACKKIERASKPEREKFFSIFPGFFRAELDRKKTLKLAAAAQLQTLREQEKLNAPATPPETGEASPQTFDQVKQQEQKVEKEKLQQQRIERARLEAEKLKEQQRQQQAQEEKQKQETKLADERKSVLDKIAEASSGQRTLLGNILDATKLRGSFDEDQVSALAQQLFDTRATASGELINMGDTVTSYHRSHGRNNGEANPNTLRDLRDNLQRLNIDSKAIEGSNKLPAGSRKKKK